MHVATTENDRISSYFGSVLHDVTPPSAHDGVSVLYVPVSDNPEISWLCASVLSEEELTRESRFSSESDAALFKQRRAFRRFCGASAPGSSRPISQIEYDETKKGRPFLQELPGVRFSFSSCKYGFLGAWSLTHSIGVDLEDSTRNLDTIGLARQYFSSTEAGIVKNTDEPKRLQVFYRLWSLKEAALKSIGEGLPFGLDRFEFELDPVLRVIDAPSDYGGPDQFSAYAIGGTDHCASLVIHLETR